jgi:hypothetical protein
MYTVLIQELSTICTDQMLTYLVFKKVHSMLGSEFSTVFNSLSMLMNDNAEFKVALKKYLNTHSLYSVD